MRVDFYQLSRDPAEAALPGLARASRNAAARLLIVSGDASQRGRISEMLWSRLPDSFLAHGHAGGPDDARQPILLSDSVDAANGAQYLAIADGLWREGCEGDFERIFYLFDDSTLQGARTCWRMLGMKDGAERRFWKQDGGKWVEGP